MVKSAVGLGIRELRGSFAISGSSSGRVVFHGMFALGQTIGGK
jgi:hypothetical protein